MRPCKYETTTMKVNPNEAIELNRVVNMTYKVTRWFHQFLLRSQFLVYVSHIWLKRSANRIFCVRDYSVFIVCLLHLLFVCRKGQGNINITEKRQQNILNALALFQLYVLYSIDFSMFCFCFVFVVVCCFLLCFGIYLFFFLLFFQ